ncbi:U7 snRNA-associated Sm-like protein LSm10 [Physella acuta]|uniref:U7 snRNA-associated Sm-like protein LSm10 n=1 Tax=Physella acuta TaxID=109671 RepID=UPI0027DCAFE2|nr:U7 snRNA-associated Sm-like protein LSm10 [Physella acuta]XP_059143483.1 U7 snRNA-associated Sm-like protein LSm10 [Physella acuta]
MAEVGSRSKFYAYNSMLCLLKALEGKYVTVEIRNDKVIKGFLDMVESNMNLNMSSVVLTDVVGRSYQYARFYIQGRQIRYVMIPDDVDIIKAMNWQLGKHEYFRAKERKEQVKLFQRKVKSSEERAAKRKE